MKSPITAQLVGGLGNQLFTYYAAASVAAAHGVPLRIDISRVSHGVSADVFGLPGEWMGEEGFGSLTSRIRRRIVHHSPSLGRLLHYYESHGPGEDPLLFHQKPGTTIRGYFQSWRVIDTAYRLGVQQDLELHSPSKWLMRIQERATVEAPVAVHVRRGDYANHGVFGLLSANYYEEALQRLRHQGHTGPVWLFSDDLDAAKKIVPEPCQPMRSPVGPQEEILAMSSASAFVTANSSFSWWGAWLSGSRNVVAPDAWFKASPEPSGLVPPWWTRIVSQWS
jgi:hypothetical protein